MYGKLYSLALNPQAQGNLLGGSAPLTPALEWGEGDVRRGSRCSSTRLFAQFWAHVVVPASSVSVFLSSPSQWVQGPLPPPLPMLAIPLPPFLPLSALATARR